MSELAKDRPRICDEQRTREVIASRGKAIREHAERTGGQRITQEQAEQRVRDTCIQQDKRHEERRRK